MNRLLIMTKKTVVERISQIKVILAFHAKLFPESCRDTLYKP